MPNDGQRIVVAQSTTAKGSVDYYHVKCYYEESVKMIKDYLVKYPNTLPPLA